MEEGSTRPASPPERSYQRYHLPTEEAPDVFRVPPRFRVDVGRWGLAKLLIKELVEYRDLSVVLSRPCVYGVFDGPLGGFAPREEKCVGCLRCTTQYPGFVEVRPNPDREALGDDYLGPRLVRTILSEARTGQVPVSGQGYRGRFGGSGWDGMWTDMSEIVRPTRDGIHGREFISTQVDLGSRPDHLTFDEHGDLLDPPPRVTSLPIPILLERPPETLLEGPAGDRLVRIYARVARRAGTRALLPLADVQGLDPPRRGVAPIVPTDPGSAPAVPPSRTDLVEVDSWHPDGVRRLRSAKPEAVVTVRLDPTPDAGERTEALVDEGADVVHLVFDYHGRAPDGGFVRDRVQEIHQHLVTRGLRNRISLIGSGGIVAAEHVPKAIIAGLDAVAIDTPLLVALQARIEAELTSPETATVALPDDVDVPWGVRRLTNLLSAWHDQLLEVLGAMGMREVRRMRGEMGRSMDQLELEREAFGDIEGYPRGRDERGAEAERDG